MGVIIEVLLTLAVIGLVGPLLYDAATGTFHEWSARLEHGLTLAFLAPLRAAAGAGLLSAGWTRWQDLGQPALIVAGIAALLTGIAGVLDPAPGTPFGWKRRLVALPFSLLFGLPALLVALAVILLGVLVQPEVFVTCLAAVLGGAVLGRRRRRAPIEWEQGVSGLPPAAWAADHAMRFVLVLVSLELVLVAAALGMAESDRLLLSILGVMERGGTLGPAMLGNGLTMGIILLLLAAPITRRTLGTLTWEPWVAGLIGLLALGALMTGRGGWWEFRVGAPMGFAAGVAGTLLAAAGMPVLPRLAPNPLRSVGRLYALLLSAMMAIGYSLSTGFLGCGTVADDPRIETLARSPSASAVQWVEGSLEPAAFVALPAEHMIMRVGIPSGDTRFVDLGALPIQALRVSPSSYGEGPRDKGPAVTVLPRLFGQDPSGGVFLLYELSDGSISGVVELDIDTALPLGLTEEDAGCSPSSWAWDPLLRLAVIGCANSPQLGLYEPSLGRTITHTPLASGRGLGATGLDHRTGGLLALAPAGPRSCSGWTCRPGAPWAGASWGWRTRPSPWTPRAWPTCPASWDARC